MVRLPSTTVGERCREASGARPKWFPTDKGAIPQAPILCIPVASAAHFSEEMGRPTEGFVSNK